MSSTNVRHHNNRFGRYHRRAQQQEEQQRRERNRRGRHEQYCHQELHQNVKQEEQQQQEQQQQKLWSTAAFAASASSEEEPTSETLYFHANGGTATGDSGNISGEIEAVVNEIDFDTNENKIKVNKHDNDNDNVKDRGNSRHNFDILGNDDEEQLPQQQLEERYGSVDKSIESSFYYENEIENDEGNSSSDYASYCFDLEESVFSDHPKVKTREVDVTQRKKRRICACATIFTIVSMFITAIVLLHEVQVKRGEKAAKARTEPSNVHEHVHDSTRKPSFENMHQPPVINHEMHQPQPQSLLQGQPPEAPSNLNLICSRVSTSTQDGSILCYDICQAALCCHEHTCADPENCVGYRPCWGGNDVGGTKDEISAEEYENSGLESVVINAQVEELCTESLLSTIQGQIDCEELCEERSCCYDIDIEMNCYHENKIWCGEYAPCVFLQAEKKTSAVVINNTSSNHDDVDDYLSSSSFIENEIDSHFPTVSSEKTNLNRASHSSKASLDGNDEQATINQQKVISSNDDESMNNANIGHEGVAPSGGGTRSDPNALLSDLRAACSSRNLVSLDGWMKCTIACEDRQCCHFDSCLPKKREANKGNNKEDQEEVLSFCADYHICQSLKQYGNHHSNNDHEVVHNWKHWKSNRTTTLDTATGADFKDAPTVWSVLEGKPVVPPTNSSNFQNATLTATYVPNLGNLHDAQKNDTDKNTTAEDVDHSNHSDGDTERSGLRTPFAPLLVSSSSSLLAPSPLKLPSSLYSTSSAVLLLRVVCSEENLNSIDGWVQCTRLCEARECCNAATGDNNHSSCHHGQDKEENFTFCQDYQLCLDLTHNVANQENEGELGGRK